ncbi:hypothetical protein AD953_15305 [Acetobacter malorum]|uniref:Uncharacterized protein n=1 Tax=Acetobacter malorum TaxID=178901 RepID=A0A149V036_9PROT|nr:DUF190 domain-containing protein [Acetobacter malorum]KXV73620.1 hypothetical protein AD953_15305 [Acetobacter malorum]
MTETKTLIAHHAGMIRIFMTRGTRAAIKGRGKIASLFRSRPLYQELIHAARQAGFKSSNAHFAHYSLGKDQRIETTLGEIPNHLLSVYVDIIGDHDRLRDFCQTHASMLSDASIYYKPLEYWTFSPELHTNSLENVCDP